MSEEASGCKAIGSGGEYVSILFLTIMGHLSTKMPHFFLNPAKEGKVENV